MTAQAEALRTDLDSIRERFRVPGAAVVAVDDGDVVLRLGLGLRDLQASLPVTPSTVFAIGSATKPFTATLLGTLVDAGLLTWDTPLGEIVPGFRLRDPVASVATTVRDALSHRSGMPRHDLLWSDNRLTRAELVRRLRHLEPSKGFREAFQYNNLLYVVAGHLAGELLGCSWEEAVHKELLAPIGMHTATFSVAEAQGAPDHATPYLDRDGDHLAVPWRHLDLVAPAGGINATADDMARWLLSNLGAPGVADPLTPDTRADLWSPVVPCPDRPSFDEVPAPSYAMGWFVRTYRGHRLVHHGGNIDGFSSECALLPDRRCGVMVLTNLDSTPARTALAFRVLDHLLGLEPLPWAERIEQLVAALQASAGKERDALAPETADAIATAPAPARPASDYTGSYHHPGYGTALVSEAGGGMLHVRLCERDMALEHRSSDAYVGTLGARAIPVPIVFRCGFDGQIESFAATLEPAVAPIVFTRRPGQ